MLYLNAGSMYREYEFDGKCVRLSVFVKVRVMRYDSDSDSYYPDLVEKLGATFLYYPDTCIFSCRRVEMSVPMFKSEVSRFIEFTDSPHWKDTVKHSMQSKRYGDLFASENY